MLTSAGDNPENQHPQLAARCELWAGAQVAAQTLMDIQRMQQRCKGPPVPGDPLLQGVERYLVKALMAVPIA